MPYVDVDPDEWAKQSPTCTSPASREHLASPLGDVQGLRPRFRPVLPDRAGRRLGGWKLTTLQEFIANR